LWKVTRSISPEISSVVGLRWGIAAFMRGGHFRMDERAQWFVTLLGSDPLRSYEPLVRFQPCGEF